MKLYHIIATLATFATAVFANRSIKVGPHVQTFAVQAGYNHLPSCAQLCIWHVISDAKPQACELNHPRCYCAQENFFYAIRDCSAATCGAGSAGAREAVSWGGKFCKSVDRFFNGVCSRPGSKAVKLPCAMGGPHGVICPRPDGSCPPEAYDG